MELSRRCPRCTTNTHTICEKPKQRPPLKSRAALQDADDGELAAALALVLEKAGVDVPHDAWTCWRDLSELSDEVRITLKTDSLRSLFAAAQFASDGTLKMSMLTVRRFHAP